jgi:SHS2 domain-containing protein
VTVDDRRGHEQIDHTADLAMRVWAPSEQELLLEAAQALIEVLTDGAGSQPKLTREISVEAVDAEDRLVQWLNEVLSLVELEGFLLADAQLELVGSRGLRALIRGAIARGSVVTELKSVTYHALELSLTPCGYRARFVIDV